MPTLQQFGLDSLAPDEQLALAEALWDRVQDRMEAEPVSPELRAELERRLELADADPDRGIPWDEVRAAARARWAS